MIMQLLVKTVAEDHCFQMLLVMLKIFDFEDFVQDIMSHSSSNQQIDLLIYSGIFSDQRTQRNYGTLDSS